MSRYKVECAGTRYFVWRDYESDTATDVSGDVTEAEAHVIAFALNAIADGRILYALLHGGVSGDYRRYSGPWEGVGRDPERGGLGAIIEANARLIAAAPLLPRIAEAARALLDDVVDHKPVKAAALHANLPVYERCADLIDLLAEYDRQRQIGAQS